MLKYVIPNLFRHLIIQINHALTLQVGYRNKFGMMW
jgi:hypothetical protein